MSVRIAAFRTHVFTSKVAQPLFDGLRGEEEIASLARVLEWGDNSLALPQSFREAQRALAGVLALEAVAWMRLGEEQGHLSPDDNTLVRSHERLLGNLSFILEEHEATLGFFVDVKPFPSGTAFLEEALAAFVSPSPAHWKYLRLLYFAPNDDWDFELGRVQAVAASLGDAHPEQAGGALGPDVVDGVRWALTGAADLDVSLGAPSAWRQRWTYARTGLAIQGRARDRMNALSVVRDRIALSVLGPLNPLLPSWRPLRLM